MLFLCYRKEEGSDKMCVQRGCEEQKKLSSGEKKQDKGGLGDVQKINQSFDWGK